MTTLSPIMDYFSDCYQVDFKAVNVLNFFGNKVEHRLILEQGEILTGKMIQYPVKSEWGAKMEQTLALHSQEKGLYCCSFFLAGKMSVIGRSQKVFTPLLLHTVSLVQEQEVYYIKIDLDNTIINPVFVEFINTQLSDYNITYDTFNEALPKGPLRFDELHQLEESLAQFIPDLDISEIENFPKVHSESDLKKYYNHRNPNSFFLHSGVGIGLITKPKGSKGILNELRQMSVQNDFSPIIQELFSASIKKNKKTPTRKILTPVTLSKSQLAVFHSADHHPLSLVVGPPGTGKSFTIAALAVDLITHGKSVLIASKNNQAGKVIAKKIEQDFGLKGLVIKSSSASFRTQLQKRLNNIFHGIEVQRVDKEDLDSLENKVTTILQEIEAIEKDLLNRGAEEMEWGAFLSEYRDTFFQRLKKRYINFKVTWRLPIWSVKSNLHTKTIKSQKLIKRYIRKMFDYYLYEFLRHERQEMQTMLTALNANTGNLMQQYFDKINFQSLLHALPAWIVNAQEVHQKLPLSKAMFDVVIIDEATQCDIASSLPLLQRGKKAIIVGDPKQLRHLSFLSVKQQRQLITKHHIGEIPDPKINYRKNSLLDLVSATINSQDQVHFLDEHYRSMPDIINFSNQHFYENRLKIMTSTPITLNEKNVFLKEVNGKRNAKGYNEEEVNAIISSIQTIIQEEKPLNKKLCQSIGILSPFRAQVTYLKNKIRKAIDTKSLQKHQILIGTPHQFQGEERDVMMLSFVVDDDTHPSTYLYLNKPDVFNVSITRSRSLQYIFISISLDQMNPKHLFTQYIDEIKTNTITTFSSEDKRIDQFSEEIVTLLKKWKVDQVYTSYLIAGVEKDIVVVHEGKTSCIDLVGYPGDYQAIFSIDRWRMLHRVGVPVFTLPYSSWYIEQPRCKRALKKFVFSK